MTNKPTDPVILICCAIATQEGAWNPGSLPLTRNNPGDLSDEGIVNQYQSLQIGIAVLFRQVWTQVLKGQTLRQLITQWVSGSDPTTYIKNVAEWTGLPTDIPILNLLPPLVKLNG